MAFVRGSGHPTAGQEASLQDFQMVVAFDISVCHRWTGICCLWRIHSADAC